MRPGLTGSRPDALSSPPKSETRLKRNWLPTGLFKSLGSESGGSFLQILFHSTLLPVLPGRDDPA